MINGNNALVTTQIQNYEQAVQIANEISRLESATKDLKKLLKAFVEKNGAVETADTIWEIKQSISYEFTAAQLRHVAEMIAIEGKNPFEYLGITSANLGKLDWSNDAIERLGSKKINTRFTSSKK